ncbi:hypothetical protein R83H12_00813 [Fibrobacteria bacterium R8-3-H12]
MATHKICLGVETDQDGLKIALVEPERKHIIKVDVVPTSGNSINDVSIYSSVLNSWTHNNLLPKINSVAVAFPACNGIMRFVSIPKEIEDTYNYVSWEFASSINSAANDYKVSVDFYPNAKKPECAIVVAMRKRIVDSFHSAELEKSGFMPSYLMADICVLHNLLESSEGLGSQPKCVLKADEKFVSVFWSNESGPIAIRLLPGDCISPSAVHGILESGYEGFPKAKKIVKLCGELSARAEFASELANLGAKAGMEIQPWKQLSKFSLEKNADFSKLSQCMGAIGATLSCGT